MRGWMRSGAYRVFTRKRVFIVKTSLVILRTLLGGAGKGDFAHNNPVCQIYTIRSVSQR